MYATVLIATTTANAITNSAVYERRAAGGAAGWTLFGGFFGICSQIHFTLLMRSEVKTGRDSGFGIGYEMGSGFGIRDSGRNGVGIRDLGFGIRGEIRDS